MNQNPKDKKSQPKFEINQTVIRISEREVFLDNKQIETLPTKVYQIVAIELIHNTFQYGLYEMTEPELENERNKKEKVWALEKELSSIAVGEVNW